MAVTAQQVLSLTSGLFKAVPSKVILTDLVKFNGNIDQLAATLGTSEFAINAFPFSNAEKAKLLAENLLGSTVTADAKAAAVTALEGILNANGGNVGSAAQLAITVINSDAAYADAKAQLENRVKVAAAYVDSARGTEISNSILNEVTKDAATVTAAIEKLNSNNTPGSDYAGTPNDDTVSLLGGLASTIKIEGGQQSAAGDTLVITAQASATANVINLQNFADQNQTLDAQQRKVSPIIQGFENVDATASTTEMNITGRDRTSELNTGSVASTQTGSVLKGGAYRDTVTGAAGADSIEGNAGNDVLNGGAGNDTIKGGADNDSITGGTGNDTIEDGTGNDTVSGGADNDTITIGGGVDLINGDEGNDTISFAADAAAGTSATVRTTVNGGAGNDSIDNTNATAASFLQVSGGANNDKITLGVATENINAGANNDIIVIKQAALDQVGTVAAGDLDVLNGNDGQDALQLLLTSGDATTTFRLTPVTGQYSGFEVIELIDESGNTNAKTYKIDLTDDFVANNFVNGQFLIDARGLPAGSNLVIDTSALTAASAARFATGAFQVWTSPSTDIRDQLNKTIDANYLINASNTALTATRAFYTNASDTTNKAGVHDATTGLITTAPAGATAYTVVGGTAETTTGGSTGGNTFTLTLSTDNTASTNYEAPLLFNAPTGTTLQSLQTGDVLTGTGSGTLNATLNGTALTPKIVDVPNQNYTVLADTTLTGNNITGTNTVINVTADSLAGATLTATGLAAGIAGKMSGQGGLNINAAAAGTAATVTLAGANAVTAGDGLTIGANYSTATLTSSTSANAVFLDGLGGVTGANSLTVNGTTDLTLRYADAGTSAAAIATSLNATNHTGVLTLRQTDIQTTTRDITASENVDVWHFAGGIANNITSTFNAGTKIIYSNADGGANAQTLTLGSVAGSTDKVALELQAISAADGFDIGALTFTGIEQIELTSSGTLNAGVRNTVADIILSDNALAEETITIKGSAALTLTEITHAAATSRYVVDATGFTGAFTMTDTAANQLATVKLGSGTSIVNLTGGTSTDFAVAVEVGTGNATIDFGTTGTDTAQELVVIKAKTAGQAITIDGLDNDNNSTVTVGTDDYIDLSGFESSLIVTNGGTAGAGGTLVAMASATAFATGTNIGFTVNGTTDASVFIDVNGDGAYSATSDMRITLTGDYSTNFALILDAAGLLHLA